MQGEPAATAEAEWAPMRRALGAVSVLVPVGIVGVDPDGASRYHNQRWEDICGTTGRSLRGRPWYLAVHPEDVTEVARRWEERIDRRGRLGRFRVVSAAGVVRECWAETVEMVGPGGVVDGGLVVVTDGGEREGEPSVPPPVAGDPRGPALSDAHVLDVVLARSRDVITIVNADGSWRWSSGGALRLIGHQPDFDAAAGILPFLHPDDAVAAGELFERAKAGEVGSGEVFEARVRAADGSWRQMEAVVDVLFDDPAVRGLVLHATDVTDRRAALADLEATNRRLADLISTVRTAVVLEDEERRVLLSNQAFVDLFRLDCAPHALEGRTLASLGLVPRMVAEPAGAPERAARMMAERRRVRAARVTLVDGRTLEYDYVPMFVDGTYRGHLSAYRDITDQARAEAERERLLASEREENRRLTEAEAFRSEVMAAVSHELRTPLTSIVGYTQLLRSLIGAERSAEEVECLDAITRNVERLLRMAGDLVALDGMESRTFPLEIGPVDVPARLRVAVRTMVALAAEHQVHLVADLEEGPPLPGDADRLDQLFENLLSNAVKFTPPGGRVEVAAGPVEGEWVVRVADDGIGIPEDEQPYLFSRFFRASNARRRGLPGSGLGLSIVRAIVDLHGGSISVSSEVGRGTTVQVRLVGVVEDDS